MIGICTRAAWRKYQGLVTSRLLWPEADFVVNDERQLIYCPIPKAACSSIKQWFLATLGENVADESAVTAMARRHRLCELSVRAAWRRLENSRAFKFSFIRNPWSRLVSGYLNKFLKADPCSARVAKRMGRCPPPLPNGQLVDISFEEFVRYLGRARPARFDVHWRPQSLFLRDHKFDFIGRFEHLRDDFAILQDRLSINVPLAHCNATRYEAAPTDSEIMASLTPRQLLDRGELPPYQQFYTPELCQIVRRIYAEDFRLGGYSLELNQSRA